VLITPPEFTCEISFIAIFINVLNSDLPNDVMSRICNEEIPIGGDGDALRIVEQGPSGGTSIPSEGVGKGNSSDSADDSHRTHLLNNMGREDDNLSMHEVIAETLPFE
jgi:hypothetical protein